MTNIKETQKQEEIQTLKWEMMKTEIIMQKTCFMAHKPAWYSDVTSSKFSSSHRLQVAHGIKNTHRAHLITTQACYMIQKLFEEDKHALEGCAATLLLSKTNY